MKFDTTHQHQLNMLDNANKSLQTAWERVQAARHDQKNPLTLQNAIMNYLQTLQQVNVMAEAAVTGK